MEDGSPAQRLASGSLTQAIIGAFYGTYNELGPGFPEFIARRALSITLRDLGLEVLEEFLLPVRFRGQEIGRFRADLLVAGTVIVEVKVSPEIERYHLAQVLHYLKASDLEVGLLVNFGRTPQFKRVIHRVSCTEKNPG
jgi:GxxExxY protein